MIKAAVDKVHYLQISFCCANTLFEATVDTIGPASFVLKRPEELIVKSVPSAHNLAEHECPIETVYVDEKRRKTSYSVI